MERKLRIGWADEYNAGVSYVDDKGRSVGVAGHINLRKDEIGKKYLAIFSDTNGNCNVFNYSFEAGYDLIETRQETEITFPTWREKQGAKIAA